MKISWSFFYKIKYNFDLLVLLINGINNLFKKKNVDVSY